MMEYVSQFRQEHPGVLEKVKLRVLRPVWHDGIVDFLGNPSWIKLDHGVSQACWNSPEFGPNALHLFFESAKCRVIHSG